MVTPTRGPPAATLATRWLVKITEAGRSLRHSVALPRIDLRTASCFE